MSKGGWYKAPHWIHRADHYRVLGLAGVGLYNLLLSLADHRGLARKEGVVIDVSLRDLAKLTGSSRNTLRKMIAQHDGVYWSLDDGQDPRRPMRFLLYTSAPRGSNLTRVKSDPGVKCEPGGGSNLSHHTKTVLTKTTPTEYQRPVFKMRVPEKAPSALARFARQLVEWHAGEPIVGWSRPEALRIFGELLRGQPPEEVARRFDGWTDDAFARKTGFRLSVFRRQFSTLGQGSPTSPSARWRKGLET